jgi:hypothetical protein
MPLRSTRGISPLSTITDRLVDIILERQGHNHRSFWGIALCYIQLLVSAGFEPTHISLSPRVTPVQEGLPAWLWLFVRNSFLREMDDQEAGDVIREVTHMCEVDCKDGEGNWAIVYMRLRFSAVLNVLVP